MEEHFDRGVNEAIIRLADALCEFERSTGIQSVIIVRDQRGYEFRALDGKPGVPDDITDEDLFDIIKGEGR
jgi:hypothetical protein